MILALAIVLVAPSGTPAGQVRNTDDASNNLAVDVTDYRSVPSGATPTPSSISA